MNGNVLVVHGGGPTAVINSSLYGVIEEAKELGLDKVYAAMGGSQAILKEDFFDSYETLIGVYCTGKTKEYLEKRINKLKEKVNSWETDINKLYEGAFGLIVKESFEDVEKDEMDEKAIFEMCEYDVMDESYSLCMNDACEKLVSIYEGIIETEESDFPIALRNAYGVINDKYVTLLKAIVFDDKYGKIVADEKMKKSEEHRKSNVFLFAREQLKKRDEAFLNRLTDYLKN